jgi:hypothetical protein
MRKHKIAGAQEWAANERSCPMGHGAALGRGEIILVALTAVVRGVLRKVTAVSAAAEFAVILPRIRFRATITRLEEEGARELSKCVGPDPKKALLVHLPVSR